MGRRGDDLPSDMFRKTDLCWTTHAGVCESQDKGKEQYYMHHNPCRSVEYYDSTEAAVSVCIAINSSCEQERNLWMA